ncbi:hypothetical protein LZ30DRAFT_733563 [Colletotrichum cereale]|nr:hypothetical protein LZ30DRAFT_733563 [Colletotrichum cereale]
MRASDLVASFSSATLASALTLPILRIPVGSVATASISVAPTATTSIPAVSTTNVAIPTSPEVTQLLSGLKTIDDAITTVKSTINSNKINLDVVEIAKSFSSNGNLNLAINNALLQTQSLNVKATSDESKRITDFFRTDIAERYKEVLQLLGDKIGDLKSSSLQDSNISNTLLGGDDCLHVISSGLKLGLANQLSTALIRVIDPAYQTVINEAGSIIQKALDGSIRVTV